MNIFKKIRLRWRLRVRVEPSVQMETYRRSEFKVQKRRLFIWWSIYFTDDVEDAQRYIEELSIIRDIKVIQ